MKRPLNNAEIAEIAAEIMRELPELLARNQRSLLAYAEPGFSGQLRRALQARGLSITRAADIAGVTPRVLADWLCGDDTLPSSALDRLAFECHLALQPVD